MRYLLITLAACTFNPTSGESPPDAGQAFTWRDAYTAWVEAQCLITERCFPDSFVETFGDQVACVAREIRHQCLSADAWCASSYPDDRRNALSRCADDMSTLVCSATDAPLSCYEALR
jgi:hypothetical protein